MILLRRSALTGLLPILLIVYMSAVKAMPPDTNNFILTAEAVEQNHLWTISPELKAPIEQLLRYEIVTEKSGPSGRSQTRQSGRVNASPDHQVKLSSVTLGLRPGDTCTVDIRVFNDATLVAETQIRLPK